MPYSNHLSIASVEDSHHLVLAGCSKPCAVIVEGHAEDHIRCLDFQQGLAGAAVPDEHLVVSTWQHTAHHFT